MPRRVRVNLYFWVRRAQVMVVEIDLEVNRWGKRRISERTRVGGGRTRRRPRNCDHCSWMLRIRKNEYFIV